MIQKSRFPLVTLVLIAINIVAAFFIFVQPDLADNLGFKPASPSLVSAIASLFLHFNVLHLLANMVFLAAVGVLVELAAGKVRYALVYLASGLAGIGVHYLLCPAAAREMPLIGASGCIAGLIGYYTARYYGIRVLIAPGRTISVATIVGVWVALQLLGAVIHVGDSTSIAFWAHLGGLTMGILLSLAFRTPDPGQRSLGHKLLDDMNLRSPAAQLSAAKDHLRTHPGDEKALRQWVDAAHVMDERDEELQALLALQKACPTDASTYGRLGEIGYLSKIPPIERRKIADTLPEGQRETAHLLLASVIKDHSDRIHEPEVLLSLVKLHWKQDRERAAGYLHLLESEHANTKALEIAKQWTK